MVNLRVFDVTAEKMWVTTNLTPQAKCYRRYAAKKHNFKLTLRVTKSPQVTLSSILRDDSVSDCSAIEA